MNLLPLHKRITAVSALCEGTSIRATGRIIGSHRDTIMRLGLHVGQGCANLHDKLFRDLAPKVVEVDEVWSFIHKKQKRLKPKDPEIWGDQYTFIGMDADQKAIISYLIGKRNGPNTATFALDLRKRVTTSPQITSDGWAPYVDSIKAAFGPNADYAMLIKKYEVDCGVEAKRRYSAADVVDTNKIIVSGSPDVDRISTSFIERQNLTTRMMMRRCTRLTNAFSKKLENHQAAFSLYVAHYNLVRRHETLGMTPAVAVGVVDHEWTTEELISEALATLEPDDDTQSPQPVTDVSQENVDVACRSGVCGPVKKIRRRRKPR